MGNSASSSSYRTHHEDTVVDFGYLTPQGVYSATKDWKEDVVTQLIIDRKIAPFYRPLDDYDVSWDDDQILAARKDPPATAEQDGTAPRSDAPPPPAKFTHHKRQSVSKELPRGAEAAIYRDATECPICFLYYPPNINHSRCCDQAICSECFVQIKRTEPTVTHMVSEPACCPFCVQENFGIVYTSPPWRTGIGSEGWAHPTWPDSPKGSQRSFDSSKVRQGKQRRFKSYDHTDPEVVTVDQIRPDWEAKLAAVQAAAARRANRRIIMRQIGDRLIPVGITSGRIHPLPVEAAGTEGDGGGSRRSRRRQQQQQHDINNFLGNLGFGGRDLEELMMMEAMRLSLLEHEAQQRREAEERDRNGAEDSSSQSRTEGPNSPSPPRATEASPDIAGSADESLLTLPVSNISSSPSTPNLANVSSNPQPLSERPSNNTGDIDSTPRLSQSSSYPTASHPTVSRMDSLASSVAPNEVATGLEGYRFLSSESEESVVAREPLLDLEDNDA